MELNGIKKLDLGGSNSYLIKGNKGYILVDAGMKGAGRRLTSQLKEMNLIPGDIGLIIITHDHYDHTGGLKEIKEITKAKVMMHVDESLINKSDKPGKENRSTLFFRILVGIIGKITPKGKEEDSVEADISIDEEAVR